MTNLEIEAFLAVASFGTLSEAAQRLYVTQPALSRRIQALEEEIGCSLFRRQKGIRQVELTKEGREFLTVARKWKQLWQETGAISSGIRRPRLNLSSVGSVSSYLFPEVFRRFLEEDGQYHLFFHNYHSIEAYGYVENGMVDLAFVTDQRYSRTVKTMPAFSEPFLLAGGMSWEDKDGFADNKKVSTEELDPSREVRLPWNNEYDIWHLRHFPETIYPHVYLDQMSLMEEFIGSETWAVVPASVGYRLREKKIPLRMLEDGPPDRMIYYLVLEENENALVGRFLYHLNDYLAAVPFMRSYLPQGDFDGVK